MIKRFKNFGKSIAVYHGLGGNINYERVDFLKSIGFDIIHYPHIDYELEWDKDKLKSIFLNEIDKCRNVDIILGFSLGGFLAFKIAGHLSKNVILINPALNREKTTLSIREIDYKIDSNFKKIEVFLGSNDVLIDKDITIDFLNRNNIEANINIIEGMEHGTKIENFKEIINKSSIIKL